ncbi:GGDEF domain-containing protein [Candidatus Venteria ishoeyi]|uniref:GGDEF domain-containing protein n=1 Tax=Candidatus Venteria ishoeyi TaxID=1899563 RepID=UPI0025A5E522|nr:GGDEF domain-containing protein [Candidatus Venteria ishoeyi]MDM8547653.1 GGDEF domain-containing protein [Candidatus Venteria ishoeyi]
MAEFERHFNTPQWQTLSREFAIEKDVVTILQKVRRLYNTSTGTVSDSEIFERYTAMIEHFNSIILMVADRSHLILDSELETYYLMEIAVKQIPDLCEAFAIIRGLGGGMIAQGNGEEKEKELLQEKISIVHNQLQKFERTTAIIRKAAPETESFLINDQSTLNSIGVSFLQTCRSLTEATYSLSADHFFQHGSDVIMLLAETFHLTIERLETRLNQRLTKYLQLIIFTLVVSGITMMVIGYFSLSFYRLQRDTDRELERMSLTDPLTSIPNRRYLNMVFDSELQRARRNGKGIAFGLLDVDFFKRFNDTYGHHEGDLALQQVAGALKRSLQRAEDFYFRFGGEEFCILSRAASLTEAKNIGERIRATIEQCNIEHRENTVSPVVTVSLGIVFVPNVTTENLDGMIKQADERLYEAKNKGRNQCIAVTLNS